jgi:very-short-patch-repair endonuclease
MTPPELAFWQRVRRKRVLGYHFRRQFPIGPYIVDFYCDAARLVVEIDGKIHECQFEDDQKRQHYLEREGYTVVRFAGAELLKNADGVVEQVAALVERRANCPHRGDAARHPTSPSGGG